MHDQLQLSTALKGLCGVGNGIALSQWHEGHRVKGKGQLSADQLGQLREELDSLTKQQDQARRAEILIPMTRKEAADFDSRQQRISQIWVILSEHGFTRLTGRN